MQRQKKQCTFARGDAISKLFHIGRYIGLLQRQKKQCTFARGHAISKLFHIGRYIGRFISQYWAIYGDILNIGRFFAANDMVNIVSATGKKRDIGRYLGRLGRYLKQGQQ